MITVAAVLSNKWAFVLKIADPARNRILYLKHVTEFNLPYVWRRKALRSRHNLNLGAGQMLLPMSYWSSGIGAEDR